MRAAADKAVPEFVETYVQMEKIPMTATGYSALQEEFKRLTSIERPRIIQAISEARLNGDES